MATEHPAREDGRGRYGTSHPRLHRVHQVRAGRQSGLTLPVARSSDFCASIHKSGCIRVPLHSPRLRCAPSPYLPSTPRSRRLAGGGASILSVRHRIYEAQHLTPAMDASWLRGTLLVLLGYLLGSIPFGILVAKAFDRGVDLRKSGSGNIGATN